MDNSIRRAQKEVLSSLQNHKSDFALAGGTALEFYYLNHRFSRDLDFFSPYYDVEKIKKSADHIARHIKKKLHLEAEFVASGKAKVRFYIINIGKKKVLKLDFVEDVLFKKPAIKYFDGIPVYDARHIYTQKITAVAGSVLASDMTGRDIVTGRQEARDILDIYYLSKKIQTLHSFLPEISREYRRGFIAGWRNFPRMDLKLGLLELEIYDPAFDASEMIRYMENEISLFLSREEL